MDSGKFVLGVLAGFAVGALAGILFAPAKGEDTRRDISKKSEEMIDELKDKVESLVDEIKSKAPCKTAVQE